MHKLMLIFLNIFISIQCIKTENKDTFCEPINTCIKSHWKHSNELYKYNQRIKQLEGQVSG